MTLSHVSLLIGEFRTCQFCLAQVLLKCSPSLYQLQLASSRLLLEVSVQFYIFIVPSSPYAKLSAACWCSQFKLFFAYDTHLQWVNNQGRCSVTGFRILLSIFTLTILLAIMLLNHIEFVSVDCLRQDFFFLFCPHLSPLEMIEFECFIFSWACSQISLHIQCFSLLCTPFFFNLSI